ncbi:MAG: phosphotransferase family protein [Microscillaceae bacterium]|nr:phosphotransferase family protein [Microscillaceae bacterium]
MPSSIDQARAVRPGEELPLAPLEAFLQAALHMPEARLDVAQFPSGYSNLTYLLRFGEKELVLRRPPLGAENIRKGHDMGREYRVLSLVHPVYPKAPQPLAYTEDPGIIGAPFYVMERIQGIILRAGQALAYSPEEMRTLSENFIDNFAALHRLDIYQSDIVQLGKPDGYLERQVSGWANRWQAAQTEAIPEMDFAIEWLQQHLPSSPPPSLIHNDYKYDNLILDADAPTQIKAVLDWEMSTVGDPFTDVGILLSYISEANDPPHLKNFGIEVAPGALSRAELVARYEAQNQVKVANLPYYYAFALFKLGVVVQQIYYRYHQGYTRDARFAPLIHLAKDCALMAKRVIQEQKISGFSA